MYGRDPNDFTAQIQFSEEDQIALRVFITSQREKVVRTAFELRQMQLGPKGFRTDSKIVKLQEKLHRERMALGDIEYAHRVAVINSTQFSDEQSDYRDELEKLHCKDRDEINKRTDYLKSQDDEAFLLSRIRNMLADFIGMVEIRMRHQDRMQRCESGGGIPGSQVGRKIMDKNIKDKVQ